MTPSEHLNESQLSNAAVPLPRSANIHKKPVVWPIDPPEHETESAFLGKCVNTTPPDGVCCKDLIEEERTLIDPDIVRDV